MCCAAVANALQIPGHSKGFEPLAWGDKPDILFCSEDVASGSQLYDDPAGVTWAPRVQCTLHTCSILPVQ